MSYTGRFNDRVKEVVPEEQLRAEIYKVNLGLELRITLDQLMNHTGAQLLSREGRAIDVHPMTVERYQQLCSLVDDYIKWHGINPEIEAIKQKWNYSIH